MCQASLCLDLDILFDDFDTGKEMDVWWVCKGVLVR